MLTAWETPSTLLDAPTPRTAWERDDEQAANQAALRSALREKMTGVLAVLSEWNQGDSGLEQQVSLTELRGAIAAVGLVVDQSAVSRLFASIDAHARPLRPQGAISLSELREALREPTWQPPPHAGAAHLGTGLNMESLRPGVSCESASCRREHQRGGGARPGSAGARHACGSATSPTGGVASLGGSGGSSRPQSAGAKRQSAGPQLQGRPQSAAASRPRWGPTVLKRPGGQRILDAGVKVGSEPIRALMLQQQALREQRRLNAERAALVAEVAAAEARFLDDVPRPPHKRSRHR